MTRNREKTKSKILAAAAGLVERHGLAALGVNGLAREAGVGKPLVYRYFGGLEGVLTALYGANKTMGRTVLESAGETPASPPGLQDNLLGFGRLLASDRLLRQRLLSMFSETGLELPNIPRLDAGLPAIGDRGPQAGQMDLAAIYAILKAAVAFLVLYRDGNKSWCDLGIETPNHLARLEYAVISILELLEAKTSSGVDAETAMELI